MTENNEEKRFVLNKEELIKHHNRLIEHPDVKLLERAIEGQRMLDEAAQIRKLLEENEQKEDDGVKNGKQRPDNL